LKKTNKITHECNFSRDFLEDKKIKSMATKDHGKETVKELPLDRFQYVLIFI